MPVRAPVIEPEVKSSDGTDGKTSDAKSASLELRLKEHGHVSVRVGSAAMPAPFAMRDNLPRKCLGAGFVQ